MSEKSQGRRTQRGIERGRDTRGKLDRNTKTLGNSEENVRDFVTKERSEIERKTENGNESRNEVVIIQEIS